MNTQLSLQKYMLLFYQPNSVGQEDYDYYIKGLISSDKIEQSDRINDIYHDFSGKIKSYILKNNGTVEDAKNLFQETLESLMFGILQKDFSLTARLGTLLHSIWKNKWLNELRRRKPEAVLKESLLKSEEVTNDESTSAELYNLLYTLMKEVKLFTPKQKTLLILILEGYTNQEIAQIEKIEVNAVAQAKSKLFKKLRIIIASKKAYQHLLENWKLN